MYDCMLALTMFLIFAAAAARGFLADKIHQICFPLAAGGGGCHDAWQPELVSSRLGDISSPDPLRWRCLGAGLFHRSAACAR